MVCYLLLLIYFLALLMVEMVTLAKYTPQTTWWNPFCQAVPVYLALSAPVLICGGVVGKVWAVLLVFLLTEVTLVAWFLAKKFALLLDEDVYLVLMGSSPQESKEFLTAFTDKRSVFVFVLGHVVMVAAGNGVLHCSLGSGWRQALLGVCLLLPYAGRVRRHLRKKCPEKIYDRTSVTRGVIGAWLARRTVKGLLRLEKDYRLPSEQIVAAGGRPLNLAGVLVIGESASRGHLQYYGYGRETTPGLVSLGDEIIGFDDVLTSSLETTSALRFLLTQATLEHPKELGCTLVDVLKAGGYRVAFMSNQLRWGRYDSPTAVLFTHCDSVSYYQTPRAESYDEVLLEPLREELARDDQPVFIVLHLIGSHSKAKLRYPPTWRCPFDGVRDQYNSGLAEKYADLVNDYDNSIAYTDDFLGQVVAILRSQPCPTFMFYLSDHGDILDVGDNQLRSVRSLDRGSYEVPYLFWGSAEYCHVYAETIAAARSNRHKPHQTDDSFWSLLAAAQLTWEGFPHHRSLFSHSYQPPARRYLGGANGDLSHLY